VRLCSNFRKTIFRPLTREVARALRVTEEEKSLIKQVFKLPLSLALLGRAVCASTVYEVPFILCEIQPCSGRRDADPYGLCIAWLYVQI